ncbi:acyl carrier protein [Sphingomonas sp. 1P06PA]|uniref:acyl carrier protein n=1 Tax=Sphingomonas sp. 1P06PA TaxID=554121 RepID=UPI0039A71EC8
MGKRPGYAVLADRDGLEVDRTVRAVLADVLGLDQARVAAFDDFTPLFGALPELDSMAVAGLLTELEDRLGIIIEDDEVDGAMLETFGALSTFARGKSLQ